MFYFFDYYLDYGASWKGTGRSDYGLRDGSFLVQHTLYRSVGPGIRGTRKEDEDGFTYRYLLRDTEPTANLLFALDDLDKTVAWP